MAIKANSAVSNQDRSRRTSIQSVDRAAWILKLLASGPRSMGVSEIADKLELARPTVHGLLQTLMAHGFVEQPRGSDKYQPSVALLQLGFSYLDVNELRARSLAHADRLAHQANAAVRVGIMHADGVVVVHHVFRPGSALQILEVGAHIPAYASALGKAILAFEDSETVDALLAEQPDPLTARTLSAASLREELAGARTSGVAFERDEAILGESSIACAIFDHSGEPLGAIGVVGETDRIGEQPPPRAIVTAVMGAARGISRELGATRWPPPNP
jgi:DNA-binding IclR family transcriptional regulator